MKGQWIKGSFFTAKSYFENKTGLIKSGLMKESDNLSQGYKPEQDGTGVLYSWKNLPLAYHGVPTLNNMVFSKKLWESIHENPFIKASMENHCWWGEDQHRDNSEVLFENVVIRVNDFHCIDNNLVIGDVDLMDTPKGLILYSLAKTGAIGNSSRGFGNLIDIGNGLQQVDEDSYLAVDWDTVGFPAVPNCMSMYVDKAVEASQALGNLEADLRKQITEAYEKNPQNDWLARMFSAMNIQESMPKTFPLASSVSKVFKKNFPDTDKVVDKLKK